MSVDAPDDFEEESKSGAKKLGKWGAKVVSNGHSAHSEVISAHGARILTDVSQPLGDLLYFELELTGSTIRQVGRVVWTSDDPAKPALGIEYVGTSDSTRLIIDEFVASELRRRA